MKSYPIIATFSFFLAMFCLWCVVVVDESASFRTDTFSTIRFVLTPVLLRKEGAEGNATLSRIGLAAAPLDRYVLSLQHFVLKRVHASCRLIDLARERDRAGQDRLELFLVLDARLRILVLDDQIGVRHVELQQLARGELMIQPVDSAVLQVAQRIVPGCAGQLVLAEHNLLLPCVELIGGLGRGLAVDPVAPL